MDLKKTPYITKINKDKELDLDKYTYFFDIEKKMYKVKRSNISQVNNINRDYFIYPNSFYNSLSKNIFMKLFFASDDFSQNISFLVVDFTTANNEQINEIIDFLITATTNSAVLDLRGHTVIFYEQNYDINFANLIDTLDDDFAVKLKVFSSCEVRSADDFFTIFTAFDFLYRNSSYRFITIADLVLKVQETNFKPLDIFKEIILKDVVDDPQMINLINSLFKHNLNITQTAQDVYMHRNTINNKISALERKTGINIQQFTGAVAIYLLLKA